MQIVIDIPEEIYQSVLNGTYCGTLYEELKNSTPLPEGHGRLGDLDELEQSMNWNEVMARELERAGTGATMTKVPDSRRTSAISLLKLEREIASQINENEAMRTRSKSYAASMSMKNK